MKQIQCGLYGENLRRFLHIQETIQKTRRAVSQGGSHLHEDILHFSGHRKHIDRAVSLASISGDTGYSYDDVSEKIREQGLQRKAAFGFGYRDGRDDQSDWMLEELNTTKRHEKKLSPASDDKIPRRTSTESLEVSDLDTPESENHDRDEIDMRLNDKITPEEEQKIYAKLCNRYGKESGRRYLLVRSLTAPEKKIEAWTIERKHMDSTASRKDVECRKIEITHKDNELCPLISEDVRKKMETLVDVFPTCTTERMQEPKRWKDALRNPLKTSQKPLHVSIKVESEFTKSVSERSIRSPCHCNVYQCDCDLIKEKCNAPKITKKCDMVNYVVDETNNYLITCRENLQDKKNNDRRVTVLQQHATKFANRDTRESVYLQSAHNQAENELMTCLMKVMPPQGQEVSLTGTAHVQQMINAISEHKMIDDHEWRAWRYAQAKMENKQNSDELDSLDSDILSSSTSNEGGSECNIKYSKGLHQSRIPYFKETFQLANLLFDKIDAKMEKMISKNHDSRKMRMQRPHSYLLKEKIRILRGDNSLFNQICKQFNSDFYNKRLTPFTERKRRKRVRANEKKVKLNRKQNQRKLIEGLQLGKKYRRPKRSFLYTEQESYRGFSQRRQKILRKTGTEKFRKCNLVGKDVTGRQLTKKVFHNDYRFIRRLFDDQLNRNKESLWDPGMKARLEEYLGTFREVKNLTEEYEEEVEDTSELTLGTIQNQRRPIKDEQKTQTALPSCWSYCSTSSGNAPEAFASMIRYLKSDDRSLADLNSTNHGNLSQCARIPSATTFGHTEQRSSQPPDSRPTTGMQPLELGTRLSKLPSYKVDTPLKGRPYTKFNQKTSSFAASDTNSLPHVSFHRRRTPTGKSVANSTKTLPPFQRVIQTNLSNKHFSKSSRTVR